MKHDRTFIIYSHRDEEQEVVDGHRPGLLHVLLQFPCELCEIDVNFWDEGEIAIPGKEIFYQVSLGFKSPGGTQSGARTYLKMDSNLNYEPHPSGVVSNINGVGYKHEKVFLCDSDFNYVKSAVECFLEKVRSNL